MRVRRIFAVGAAAALTIAMLVATPSLASSVSATTPTARFCGVVFGGVTAARRLVFGQGLGPEEAEFYQVNPPLTFTPAHLALDGRGQDGTGYYDDLWANGTDGTLRHIRVHFGNSSDDPPTTTMRTVPLGYRLTPRLFTVAGSTFTAGGAPGENEYIYRVSPAGNLYRDTYHAATTGRPEHLDSTVALGQGLIYASTLTAHKRITLDGERADVLFATTKYGRLFEITVPVKQPTRIHITVLATSGFAGYAGLGAQDDNARCEFSDGYVTTHVLTAVKNYGNGHAFADYIAIRTTHHPKPADVERGFMGFSLDEELYAVY